MVWSVITGEARSGVDQLIDAGEVRRAMEVLADPLSGIEIRGLTAGLSRRRRGDDCAGIIRAADELNGLGMAGVYYTLNPVLHSTIDRAAKDIDVLRRRWLLLDIDPVKPDEAKDDPPTEGERLACCRLARTVREYLSGLGWPMPVEVDSGGGMHLLYRVDLPNDSDAREAIKGLLYRLADHFDGSDGKIDRKVHNASRIAKLPGTWARRGNASTDRPYRMATLQNVPGTITRITLEQIRSACQEVTETLVDAPIPETNGVPPPNWSVVLCPNETNAVERAYGLAALSGECETVRATAPGDRNNQLNTSALKVGHYVPHILTETEVIDALLEATTLPRAEASRAIRSGLTKGMSEPRLPSLDRAAAGTHVPPTPEEVEDYRGKITRIADLVAAGAEMRWLWKDWIPVGVLTLLAAEGGTGKTRFCADLLRRIRHRQPWPDGQPMTLDPDASALWVLSDNHHDEMVELAHAFDIEKNIWINSDKTDVYGGVSLDRPEDLKAMEARIMAVRPVLAIIDTVGNSTDRNLSRQEDAKAYYAPLQAIARRCSCAIVCVTHLNAGGGVLGRRAVEKVRSVLRMSRPDPDGQPNRRRLEVHKSNAKYPPPLGITMGDKGNDYDGTPPAAPEEGPGAGSGHHKGKRGPSPVKLDACKKWLEVWLSGTAQGVKETRSAAETEGFSATTLYAAVDALNVHEATVMNKKWWSLTRDSEGE